MALSVPRKQSVWYFGPLLAARRNACFEVEAMCPRYTIRCRCCKFLLEPLIACNVNQYIMLLLWEKVLLQTQLYIVVASQFQILERYNR